MRQNRLSWHGLKDLCGGLCLLVALVAALALALPGVGYGQSQQCWTLVNGVWTYNPACSQTPNAPLRVAVGKQLTVNNTLTLSGQDNAQLNIGAGGTLGSAAYASAQSFQPAGGALNLVGTDIATTVTNGTSTSCSVGQITWSHLQQTGLGFSTGMMVTAYETASPGVYMQGSVCSYSGTMLTISSSYSQGTYTGTGWTIQISGPQGPQGATGTGAAPIGSIDLWGSASLPTNYLWASGPSFTPCVSKTTYAALYTGNQGSIGDTWTNFNGCTGNNFGLPPMAGRFPLGAGTGATAENGGSGTTRNLGQMSAGGPNGGGSAPYGAETHTQIVGEIAVHSHGITDPGHYHSVGDAVSWTYGSNAAINGSDNGRSDIYQTGIAYTGISINTTGSSSPMNIMNPFAVLNYIIRYQ